MARDNSWYRRTSWTEADRAAFDQWNRRSRGPQSKAQYIRLQAEALRETGKPELVRAALDLLEASFRDLPVTMESALAFECAGRCCEQLGEVDRAAAYYRMALEREQVFPGIQSLARFQLGQLATEHGRADLYDVVLSALERFGPSPFPWHAYMINGIKAIIASERGNIAMARQLATAALQEAAVRDAAWGRDGIGVVKQTSSLFHEKIAELAGA